MSTQVRNWWRVKAVTAGLVTIVLGTAAPARAGVPSDQLRVQVDRVVSVLDDTELRKSARAAERRAANRRIANETFDFTETSQRALGPHWQARTPAVTPRSIPYSWKIPLSGYAPEYAYERGRFDRSMTFEELKWRGHINALAYAADQAPDFSRRIRVSLP